MSTKWYYSRWVDAFYLTLVDGGDGLDEGSSLSRPTEQTAFRSLAIQAIHAMKLRYVDELKENAYD